MKILHVVLNTFTNDTRVLRAAYTAVELGASCTVFALHQPELPEWENIGGIKIKRFRAITSLSSRNILLRLLGYVHTTILMIVKGHALHPDLIHANDLPALPLAFLIARITGGKLIYDSHELWADSAHRLLIPKWVFQTMRRTERYFARRANAVITVSNGIADYMTKDLNIARPTVVRNLPLVPAESSVEDHPLRNALSIPADVPVILYQGRMVRGRDLITLVEAMGRVNHPKGVLVLLGDGPLVPTLKKTVQQMGIQGRVLFHPAVPAARLHHWTKEATLGICVMEASCLSHRFSLPNKLFEYIQAGLPVLASDLPEMRRIILQYGVGEIYTEGDAAQLAAKIDRLLSDDELRENYRRAAKMAAQTLHWGTEKQYLIELYQELLELTKNRRIRYLMSST